YKARFASFGWETVVVDGHNVEELLAAFAKARETSDKPFCIVACTYKGHGVSFLNDKEGWHGKPLNAEQAEKAIAEIEQAGVKSDYKLEIKRPQDAKPLPVETKKPEAPSYKLGDAIASREAFGEALKRIGATRSNIVGL